jgi:hypothetical protein
MDKIEISVNVITGEVTQTVSEFTAEELAYSAQINAEIETEKADAQAIIDTKASALAKLAALGLTQEEVKALIG